MAKKKFSGRPIYELMAGVAVASGCRPERIARNTMRYVAPDGATVYRLHTTDIVTVYGDRTVTIDNGGWLTVTTRDRVNQILRIIQREQGWESAPFVAQVFGGRAWYCAGHHFCRTLTFKTGVPVDDATEIQRASEARLDYIAMKRQRRADARERRKAEKIAQQRARFGAAFDLVESERARAQGVES